MQAIQTDITNLEALFGDMEEQLDGMTERVSINANDGMVMTTLPCAGTATRISIVRKC
ncbi:hypothetical protein [Streptomyces chryseus]